MIKSISGIRGTIGGAVDQGLTPIDAVKFQQGLRDKFIERDGMFFTGEQAAEYDEKKAKVIDSINQLKLYRIVVDYDFFPEYSFNQVGNYNIDNYDPEISVLVMHIRSNKADFWKPILLDLIRRGRAPARLYGGLSDSVLRSNGVFDYGIYQNIGKDKINDFENLDKRRIAVGLPTLAYQNFVYQYWQKEYEKYKKQNGN